MKRIAFRVGLVVILAAGIGAAVWYVYFRPSTGPADRITLYGNVEIRQVELAFNGSGRITALRVEEGDRVEPGQTLAVLDTSRLKHAVDRAEARVAAQQEVVARLEAGAREEEIRKLRAEVAAAETEAENARRTYRRLVPLAAESLASEERTDDARARAEAAEARLTAVREQLNLALAGARKEEIAGARATLEALRAELALARQELDDATLTAPSAGVVRNRILEPGDMASPQRPVLTLALTSPVWVRAYVPETDLGRIAPGMAASVHTDTFPEKSYPAWVGYISPAAEFTPKSVETPEVRTHLVYQVRVMVRNPENELRLGMPATVVIPTDGESPAGSADGPPPRPAEE